LLRTSRDSLLDRQSKLDSKATAWQEVSIQLLGGFRLCDAAGKEIKIPSRKGRALLAYLATRANESHPRDRLAMLLWEDADEELARTSLRQALAALRKALPQPILRADIDSIALDGAVATDLAELRQALTTSTMANVRRIVDCYRGDLLEGLDARSTAFEDWLSQERLALRQRVTQALQKLTALCVANEDTDGALLACTKLVALEPLNEAAHRTLMELHARRNAYAEALRQYRICRDALRRELDVAPEPATEALYRELMRRRRAGSVATTDEPATEHAEDTTPAAPEPTHETRPALRDAVVSVARLEGLLELESIADPEEALTIAERFHSLVRETSQAFGGRTIGAPARMC
jgi:DNA-binding SARP family transcriptional activator